MAKQEPTYENALAKALRRLEKGDAFEAQIRTMLARGAFPEEIIERVVMFLVEHRILNDARVAEQVVGTSTGRKAAGKAKLEESLRSKGASHEVVAQALQNRTPDQEREMMLNLLKAKYKPSDKPDRAARFLLSRGFSEEQIESVLSDFFPAREYPEE